LGEDFPKDILIDRLINFIGGGSDYILVALGGFVWGFQSLTPGGSKGRGKRLKKGD
jgi:hypothetical protein